MADISKTKKSMSAKAYTVTGVGWADKEQACIYASIGMRTLDRWISEGLLHSKIGGCLRIRYTDLDAFMLSYQAATQEEDMEKLNEIVDTIVKKVTCRR